MTKLGFFSSTSNTTLTSTAGDASIDDVTPRAEPGTAYWYKNSYGAYCVAVYVQFIDAIAYVKGGMVGLADDNTPASAKTYIVTNDYSEVLGDKLMVAGVCYGVQTTGRFGFIQVRGPGIVLNDNGDDAAIGDPLIVTAVDNLIANVAAQTPETGIGFSTSAVNATTNLVTAQISIGNQWWNE